MSAHSEPTGLAHVIGVLGGTRDAVVDRAGTVAPRTATWELDWWIGADDRWHVPAREAAVRQQLVDGMPVVQTAMRVPGGDALHRAFGAPEGDVGEVAVVDVTNDSPAPFVAALVVRGAGALDVEGSTVWVDGRPALRTVRPASRWAVTVDGSTEAVVTAGEATDAPFGHHQDRAARLVAAFLFPVAHRTTLRTAVALRRQGLGTVEPAGLPDAEAVARGWRAQLRRGMQVTVPDERLQAALDSARASTVLAGQAWHVDPVVAAALEDWGLDDEAAVAWSRLSGRERRRLRRRVASTATWDDVFVAAPGPPSELLAAVRAVVAHEDDGTVALLGDWPAAWVGQAVDVRDVPSRNGPVSCSIRWHGDRPALLWEAPPGVRISVPGLDPAWSSTEGRGEALLAPFSPRR